MCSPCLWTYHASVARSSKVPEFVTPMAAISAAELPEGEEWLYELKLDGSSYSATVRDSRMSSSRAAGVARSTRVQLPRQTGMPTPKIEGAHVIPKHLARIWSYDAIHLGNGSVDGQCSR